MLISFAEVRNAIYDLSCTPIIDTTLRPSRGKKDDYSVDVHSHAPIYISPLSKLCQQIRGEYLSLLLSKHEIRLTGLDTAYKWLDIFGDNLARKPRALSLECEFSTPFGPGTDMSFTGVQHHLPATHRSVRLRGDYDAISDNNVYLKFVVDCGHAATLRRASRDDVYNVIVREIHSGNYFTFGGFLNVADQISQLDLKMCAIDAPIRPGLEVIFRRLSFDVFPPSSWGRPEYSKKEELRIYTHEGFRYYNTNYIRMPKNMKNRPTA